MSESFKQVLVAELILEMDSMYWNVELRLYVTEVLNLVLEQVQL